MSILIERDVTLSLADAFKNLVGSCKDSLDKVFSYPIKVPQIIDEYIQIPIWFLFFLNYLMYFRFMMHCMVQMQGLLLILLHQEQYACMYF